MKTRRLLASILVLTSIFSLFTVSVSAVSPSIGTVEELQSAIEKARRDDTIITLTDNISGPGLVIDKNIILDLNNYTYTVTEDPVDGIVGFKLMDGNKITIRNGVIKSTEESGVETLLQNYSNLILIDVDFDGRNLGNNGITYEDLNGETSIKKCVFYTSEDGIAIKVHGDSNTTNNSVFFRGGNIISGTFVYEDIDTVSIKAEDEVFLRTPDGFLWVDKLPNLQILQPANVITYVLEEDNAVNKKYQANTNITLDYQPKKEDYVFLGWYLDENLTRKVEKITLNEDTTLYAKWEKDTEENINLKNQYSITFMSSTGTKLDTVKKREGIVIDLYEYKYSVKNHRFKGWYANQECTERLDSLKVTEDVTIYGKYIQEEKDYFPILTEPLFKKKIFVTDHIAYVQGRNNGMIYPNANITRAEVATMLYRLLTPTAQDYYYDTSSKYQDLPENYWAKPYISALTHAKLLNGRTENLFKPEAYITRAEFVTVIYRIINGSYFKTAMFPDIEGHWAQEQISFVADAGYVNGSNGLFRPDDFITRAEAIAIINRVFDRQPEDLSSLVSNMITFKDNQNTDAWYYLDIQEATNTHTFSRRPDGIHEDWIKINN